MNIQIANVLTDITGVTGLAILDAIVRGERDPNILVAHRDRRVKASAETIAKSLVGDWRAEHLFCLKQALENWRHYQRQIAECDARIEACLTEFKSQADPESMPPTLARKTPRRNDPHMQTINLREELFRIFGVDLTAVPGLEVATVYTILAEMGATFTDAFPTASHFASWLCLCPNRRVTGGQVKSSKVKKAKQRVAVALRVAAQSLHAHKGYLGDYYRRMRTKLGTPEAMHPRGHYSRRPQACQDNLPTC
jgi:transposase